MDKVNFTPNFKANRIVSVTRYIDKPVQKFERFDVYRINKKDIPFIKKVFAFMEKRKFTLDDMQKRLLEQLRKILNDKYYFVEDRLYLGIKDDNYITGFISSIHHKLGYHESTNLCTSRNNVFEEDVLAYAIQKDTSIGRVYGDISNYAYYKKDILPNIERTHSDYIFNTSKPSSNYDLEEVLGIKE